MWCERDAPEAVPESLTMFSSAEFIAESVAELNRSAMVRSGATIVARCRFHFPVHVS